MPSKLTTIKVRVETRDRLRRLANEHDLTFDEAVNHAMRAWENRLVDEAYVRAYTEVPEVGDDIVRAKGHIGRRRQAVDAAG